MKEAYIEFVHFVERVHAAAEGGGGHEEGHEGAAEPHGAGHGAAPAHSGAHGKQRPARPAGV
jgi:hypothetical protein